MPLDFQCPHCGFRTNVDDRYSGQSGPCAHCGKTVTIPTIGRAVRSSPPSATGGGAILALLLIAVVAGLLFCGGVGMFWIRAVPTTIPAANMPVAAASQCTNNLKMLGVAMHNYLDTYDSFPPAYLADEQGKPMHSWRVLLLPFLGRQDLYEQYDFHEPWDGPNNALLLSNLPPEYRCPADAVSGYEQTSYAMIVGPGMLSDGQSASQVGQINDGVSNTLMLVETHGAGIAWTEPRDLDGTTMSFLINTGQPGEINGHAGQAAAVFCDGFVRELLVGTPPEDLRAMATIAGGEVVAIP